MSRHADAQGAPGLAAASAPATPRPAPATETFLLLLTLAQVCFQWACGAQGPPRPPRVERPARVTDLAITQIGPSFEIRFTLPQLAEDGERLTKPLEVDLLRAVVPAGQTAQPGENLQPWVSWQAGDLSRSAPGQNFVSRARLSDKEFDQWRGVTFQFALRGLTRGFHNRPIESETSNAVTITLLDVSEAVKDLRVTTTEKALELRWGLPERTLANRPLTGLSGYRIYRSTKGAAGPFEIAGESSSNAYDDRDFVFGRTYFYRVRAVFRENKQTAESEDSQTVEVIPKDTFPPAAPTGVTAAYAQGVVDLIWTANTEPDLAGYNVYRSEKGASTVRLNRGLIKTPLFRDPSVQPGREYLYRVTAVDLAGNESPASADVPTQTQ